MSEIDRNWTRRAVLAGAGCASLALLPGGPARAANLGATLTGLLGRASDSALDQLSQPGAFYNDPAVRIALPLVGRSAGGALDSLLNVGQQFGLTNNITRKLNDAAGLAARAAKPVFRTAISRLTLADVPGIATQADGATQYLQRSAGAELKDKLRPLVDAALLQVGAYRQVDRLARTSSLIRAAGITREKLGDSVSTQALGGIFRYIGAEEGKLRADPLGSADGLLKGLLGN
ncbi:MAG: DUF4197 domain-containing protein [Novosphingobium sp.]|jgi:hypothetical protein|nr:DUF4197 domain-containing protein [Novosphingobium sp.]